MYKDHILVGPYGGLYTQVSVYLLFKAFVCCDHLVCVVKLIYQKYESQILQNGCFVIENLELLQA